MCWHAPAAKKIKTKNGIATAARVSKNLVCIPPTSVRQCRERRRIEAFGKALKYPRNFLATAPSVITGEGRELVGYRLMAIMLKEQSFWGCERGYGSCAFANLEQARCIPNMLWYGFAGS